MQEIRAQDIAGFRFGNAQDLTGFTGCTAIICEEGAVCGVDVRGGSPGTRDTDRLSPVNNHSPTNAIVLAGGSAFGLDAAGGAMRFLEERGIGRNVGITVVPLVSSAILFDLKFGDHTARPDGAMGYAACEAAYTGTFEQGSVGAGTGATIGKARGGAYAMKGGLGAAAFRQGDLEVGAVMAVNCVGDVYDSREGRLLAGTLADDRSSLADSEKVILEAYAQNKDLFSGNTIIGTIVTNAALTYPQAAKLASVSHNGIARAVRPAHSIFDGDTMFALATGKVIASFDSIGILAVEAVRQAIINAIRQAKSLGGRPAYQDLPENKSKPLPR